MPKATRSSVQSSKRSSRLKLTASLPLAGKRIGLLSSWVSRSNGGVFEAVLAQADVLTTLGAQPVVLGLRDRHAESDIWRLGGHEHHLCDPWGPHAAAYAPALASALMSAELDLLHLNGIWQYPSHVADLWKRATARPLVISPHGMLDPWITSRNAWKKHLGRILWERKAWQNANAFHALTDAEARDIARETGGAEVATIPNSAPSLTPPGDATRPPMALYIGRIHEKKNLGALISAWQIARTALPKGSVLTIAGWGDDDGIDALEHAMRDVAGDGIEFVGTVFGSQKAALLDLARFVVLPSLSEGLPMAILEAWAAGVPTIMSEHCHLPDGFAAGAALGCGTSPEDIAATLIEGFALSEPEWRRMSDAATALAAGPYSSTTLASRWERFYADLLA